MINNKIVLPLTFIGGFVIGAACMWFKNKSRNERIDKETTEYVRKLRGKYEKEDSGSVVIKEEKQEEDTPVETAIGAYEKILNTKDYKRVPDEELGEYIISEEEALKLKTHIITPDEFDMDEDYEKMSLTYYADGILADENNDPVSDLDFLMSDDILSGFGYDGEYEPDSIFVRNDELQCDYELLRDHRTYSEAAMGKPY